MYFFLNFSLLLDRKRKNILVTKFWGRQKGFLLKAGKAMRLLWRQNLRSHCRVFQSVPQIQEKGTHRQGESQGTGKVRRSLEQVRQVQRQGNPQLRPNCAFVHRVRDAAFGFWLELARRHRVQETQQDHKGPNVKITPVSPATGRQKVQRKVQKEMRFY